MNPLYGDFMQPFKTRQVHEVLRSRFHTRCNDVFLVMYPKAGSHWMSRLMQQLMNNTTTHHEHNNTCDSSKLTLTPNCYSDANPRGLTGAVPMLECLPVLWTTADKEAPKQDDAVWNMYAERITDLRNTQPMVDTLQSGLVAFEKCTQWYQIHRTHA